MSDRIARPSHAPDELTDETPPAWPTRRRVNAPLAGEPPRPCLVRTRLAHRAPEIRDGLRHDSPPDADGGDKWGVTVPPFVPPVLLERRAGPGRDVFRAGAVRPAAQARRMRKAAADRRRGSPRDHHAPSMLTSNPRRGLGTLLGDTATVAAFLDQLVHHTHVLTGSARSWRTRLRGSETSHEPPRRIDAGDRGAGDSVSWSTHVQPATDDRRRGRPGGATVG